jgi:perosamine synthetase
MIPRYHPQIRISDILWALLTRSNTCSLLNLPNPDKSQCEADFFWMDSGTSALAVALLALNLPENSGVAVPVYSCVTVFEAVAAVGLKCVFIDLDPQTLMYDYNSLEKHKNEFQAVIFIHLFGFVADIVELQRVVGSKPIIEDCSHAFGSADSQGNPVGRAGAVSIFSFNIHKPLSAGGGGLLLVNDRTYLAQVKRIYASVPSADGINLGLLKLMLKVLCFHPVIYGLLTRVRLIKFRRLGSLGQHVIVKKISKVYLRIICSKLKTSDRRWEKQRRYAQNMTNIPVETPVNKLGHQFWNAYLLPLLTPEVAYRERLLTFFNKKGIDAFELWPEYLDTASRFGYTKGECDNTENFVKRLFFIPCYAELTQTHFKRIVQTLAQAKNLGWL